MRTSVAATFALCSMLLALGGAGLSGQEQETTFRSVSRTVAIYATVTDAERRLVPDLVKDDFEVFDNGKRQKITLFANDIQPISVVMMLDRSGSMLPNFNLVRAAAEQFVAHLLPV